MEKLMFDYRSLADQLAVPSEIIQQFEQEAHKEFPFDNMLMEIHILRAVKAYAKTSGQKRKAADILTLFGIVEYDADYDYKEARRRS